MKRACLCCFLFISVHVAVKSQSSLCLGVGASAGRNGFADIGLSRRSIGSERHSSMGVTSFSVEMKPGSRFIIGPKVGVWGFSMTNVCIGLNLIYYTDFDKGSLVFRPEAGVAVEFGKLVYGYNCSIVNRSFAGVNKHQVAILFLLKLKDIKEKQKPQ